MRTYERTNSWLKFSVNLRQAPARLWINLGEIKSICEQVPKLPIFPKIAFDLNKQYVIRAALANCAIDGNSLTEEEISGYLKDRGTPPSSRHYLVKEVANSTKCVELIEGLVTKNDGEPLTPALIRQINRLVLDKLSLPEDVIPGEIKEGKSGAKHSGAPAEDCEYLLQALCDWLNSESFTPPPGFDLVYGIIRAVIAHIYLVWIHPFGAGNGRTARLVEYMLLFEAGIPSLAAVLPTRHYSITRNEYFRLIEASGRGGGDIETFLKYSAQGFLDCLREQAEQIRSLQGDIIWLGHIREVFGDNIKSAGYKRKENLLIDLSGLKTPAPVAGLSEISGRVAKAYARRSGKTLNRDLNSLIGMGLVEKTGDGVQARKVRILPFREGRTKKGED
jgi:Fic family protein